MYFERKHNLPEQNIKQEHARFLGAVFIAAFTEQASVVVDSAIGGVLLGEKVVSAVNLVLPIEEVFFALTLLFGMGACTAASFAFGKGDNVEVRRHFAAAIISAATVFVVLAVGLIVFREQVVDMLCGESYLQEYTLGYFISVLPWFVFGNLVGIVIQFVSMTGKPQLAMYASIVFCVANALFDWLLVGVLGCGIKGLGYSSVISIFIALIVILPYWVRFIKCSLDELVEEGNARPCVTTGFRLLMEKIRDNIHYGKGLISCEIVYILFEFTMNAMVLRYLGEEELFCWSVVMMLFLVCDFAAAASQETCLSLGGRYVGVGRADWSKMVFRRSMVFTVGWVMACVVASLLLPDQLLPLFGAPDATIYPTLIPVIALTIPVTIGLNLVNLYLVRLIIHNQVERFTILIAVLYLSVPMFFCLAHLIIPGYEWWGVLALSPLQLAISKNAYDF